jgi:hypothetical protein
MTHSSAKSPEWYRAVHTDVSVSGIVATGTAGVDNAIVVPGSLWTIFIQKITIVIRTLAAQTISLQDDANTPVPAYVVEASAAAGVIRTIDFGARGFALTEAKNFDISGTAGPAYSYAIDAYARQTATGQSDTVTRII